MTIRETYRAFFEKVSPYIPEILKHEFTKIDDDQQTEDDAPDPEEAAKLKKLHEAVSKMSPQSKLAFAALIKLRKIKTDGIELVEKTNDPVAEIFKLDQEQRIVGGVVLEPWTNVTADGDAHGDSMSESEIEKTAHGFLSKHRVIGLMHKGKAEATLIESYIAPVAFKAPDGQMIKKGSWIQMVKINSDGLWNKIKDKTFNAFSPGGFGRRKTINKFSLD